MRHDKMKTASFLVCIVFFILPLTAWAGDLEPSAPPSGTMHTLEDIYNQVAIKGLSDAETQMNIILSASVEYYKAHKTLPDPIPGDPPFGGCTGMPGTDVNAGNVPAAALGIGPILVNDPWGQPYEYHIAVFNSGAWPAPEGDVNPAGVDVDVDGDIFWVAGVIISYGPDQISDYACNPYYADTFDDIIVPINVSAEATAIALYELKMLQTRAMLFDALYAGIDNDGDGLVDCVDGNSNSTCDPGEEGSCEEQTPWGTGGSCPATGGDNDPKCGTATLDHIEECLGDPMNTYDCPSYNMNSTLEFIISYYSLPDRLGVDPWGRFYRWGNDGGSTSGGTMIDPLVKWYHTFYSEGPDYILDDDDIFPY